jgi:[glutamine synthetase] adenylyltransferase / [glutamine synthetase]-adenylyl-L-tyrosine phosphorylase
MSDALHFYPNIWPEHSAYAKRWLTRFPEWDSEDTSQEHLLSCIQRWIKQVKPLKSEEQIMSGLRRMRQRCMIEVMKRDLLGKAELFDITEALSFLADSSVQIALEFAHAQQAAKFGNPSNGDCLIVVGMGKLGGLELNVSSDIDLIFLYGTEDETEGGPTGRKQSHAEFFTQVGRKIIKMLSEVTDEGFVFRVDMRLRPNGDSGPLVSSLDMLEEYFLVQGREWERYAWIKSRVINWAIDPTQDDAFQNNLDTLNSIVRPFVYRKYLDFGAIRALRNLHVQIRNEVNKRELHHPGSIHVKLGRGGIREIEFIAQAFQLIRGGRQPQLQLRRTVDALAICAEQDLMTPSELDKIQAAYYFLRNLEHRLQYIDDAQTHRLPADPTQVLKIARSMGFEDPSIFMKALKSHMEFVSNHFDQVFGDKCTLGARADSGL